MCERERGGRQERGERDGGIEREREGEKERGRERGIEREIERWERES